MTNTTLANYANLSLYSAMTVLALSMIAYAVYLARLAAFRDRVATELAVPQPVAVGGARAVRDLLGGVGGVGHAGVEAPADVRKAGGIANSLGWLGTALLVASVVLRGASVARWPLGNMFEFAVFACMFVMVIYSVASRSRDLRWLGVFIVGATLLVLSLGVTVWYAEAAELMPSLKSVWLAIHVTVATLAIALFGIGCVTALLYLVKDRWSDRAGWLSALPTTQSLERLAYGLHIVAFPLWTFTLIAGAIWARQAWGAYWNWDPKEVWSFVIWVVYAAYLHARVTRGWRRQSATWIAVAGFVCVILNYTVVNVYFVGMHSYSGL